MASSAQEAHISLAHISFNTHGTSTILFIHGAGSDGGEWKEVVKHLRPTYHVLVPDLPFHGGSFNVRPLTLAKTTPLLADIIRSEGRNGKAHIVGLSLGSAIALDLAAQHPELVEAIVISGWRHWTRDKIKPAIAPFLYYTDSLVDCMPRGVVKYFMSGADQRPSSARPRDVETMRQVIELLVSAEEGEGIRPVLARTLVVAATKSGLVPSGDNSGDAKMVLKMVRRGNDASRAVSHGEMRHPWNKQDPMLFAETVQAWIERRALPVGFRMI